MTISASRSQRSVARMRTGLAARLGDRRAEINESILARIHAVYAPTGQEDAEYVKGFRATLVTAVDYALAAIAEGGDRCGPVPPEVLAQAGHAVRNRIGLETVLRRYFAGYTALSDFVMAEGREVGLVIDGATLHLAQRELATVFDRTVAAVSAEYERAAALASRRSDDRFAERVKRLLAGEPVDTTDLGYDLDAWHIAIIAAGPASRPVLRGIAGKVDRRLLMVPGSDQMVWAWLGGRQRLDAEEVVRLPRTSWPAGTAIVVGEPAQGLAGWRLSHRQARAALRISSGTSHQLTRYADVALLAAIDGDEDFKDFLVSAFLAPLCGSRDDGTTMRQTLSAYFASGRNASAAAAALGVSRRTVASRLAKMEERLGRRIDTCMVELEAALRISTSERRLQQ